MTDLLKKQREPNYLLGNDPRELARLERQGALLGASSTALLRIAGLQPGMRVLDLGCGAGDLTMIAAELVGPEGAVHGIDQSADALGWASARVAACGLAGITFEQADVETYEPDRSAMRYDAVIGRLVHLYLRDPVGQVRRSARHVVPGGRVIALEYDIPGLGATLDLPLVQQLRHWIVAGMTAVGVNPALGPQMSEHFGAAGLPGAQLLATAQYSPPGTGGWHGAETTRSMLPAIIGRGIATADDIDIDTLEERLNEATGAAGTWFRHPVLVGTWAQV